MPRDGSGVYTKPANTTASPNTTIESTKFNTLMDDIAADLNTDRPVVAGGTGASSAGDARANLGAQAQDATLDSLAALGTAADRLAYTTGVDTWAEAPISAFGRSLIDDAAASNARATLGLETIGQAEAEAGTGTTERAWTAQRVKQAVEALGGGGGAPDIILEDQRTSGTHGGTASVAGSWETREVNTELRDVNNDCTVASNQFTLSTGTYYIEWEATHYNTDSTRSKLYNISDASDVAFSNTAFFRSSSDVQGLTLGAGVLAIASSKVFEIRSRVANTISSIGRGRASAMATEIYLRVKIWRLS